MHLLQLGLSHAEYICIWSFIDLIRGKTFRVSIFSFSFPSFLRLSPTLQVRCAITSITHWKKFERRNRSKGFSFIFDANLTNCCAEFVMMSDEQYTSVNGGSCTSDFNNLPLRSNTCAVCQVHKVAVSAASFVTMPLTFDWTKCLCKAFSKKNPLRSNILYSSFALEICKGSGSPFSAKKASWQIATEIFLRRR